MSTSIEMVRLGCHSLLFRPKNYTSFYLYTTIAIWAKFKEVHKMKDIIIGTENSELAMAQARSIMLQLKATGVEANFEIQIIERKDKQNVRAALYPSLNNMMNDIQIALREGRVDFAVHHLRDYSLYKHEKLTLAAIPTRKDHRNVYVGRTNIPLEQLGAGALIGLENVQKAAFIHALYPHLKTKIIDDSIHMSLERLRQGKYAGLIFDLASLTYLDLVEVVTHASDDSFLPQAGQGALALECRTEDYEMIQLLGKINDQITERAVLTEREFVRLLDEDQKAPIGVYAEANYESISLRAAIVSLDGQEIIKLEASGTEPKALAEAAANEAIERGAESMIDWAKEQIALQ